MRLCEILGGRVISYKGFQDILKTILTFAKTCELNSDVHLVDARTIEVSDNLHTSNFLSGECTSSCLRRIMIAK